MIKRGLIVGINYTGTGNDLHGCINDAHNMAVLLLDRGFDVQLILEKDATTAGIKAGLAWLVKDLTPGDVIVFHYSGHGSQLPSKKEPDGFEEIICPIDLNWTTRVITDDTLRQVFDTVAKGVNTTLILDCCHSGDALDQSEGDSVGAIIKKIASQGGRYLTPPTGILTKLESRELVNWSTAKDVNDSALLIAGCHSNQTSADALIDGISQGAATAALIKAVKANPSISYRDLVESMTSFMIAGGYTQRPELDGFTGLWNERFLEPFGAMDQEQAHTMKPPGTEPLAPAIELEQLAPAPTASQNSFSSTKILIVAVIAALLAFVLF